MQEYGKVPANLRIARADHFLGRAANHHPIGLDVGVTQQGVADSAAYAVTVHDETVLRLMGRHYLKQAGLKVAVALLRLVKKTLGARALAACAIGYTRTITGNASPRFEFVGGELVAPDAAAIKRDGLWIICHAFERGPVTKKNRLAFCQPALVAKPRQDFFAGNSVGDGLRALTYQVQLAFAGAIAHPGEVVGNHPQASHATEAVVPHKGVVAIHLGEELLASRAL